MSNFLDVESKKTKKIPGRYVFLLLVLLTYGVCAVFNQEVFLEALQGFYTMLLKVIPILTFVFVLLIICDRFIQPKGIQKHLGRNSGIRGWFYAVVGGILIMGPPYVLYPMLAKLRSLGVRDSLIAVFLYNRNVKIPFLPAMVFYLGLYYTLVLSVYIIIFSVINGLLVEWLMVKFSSADSRKT